MIGRVLFSAAKQGNHEQARDYLTRALELFNRMGLPADHPNIETVTQALAELD